MAKTLASLLNLQSIERDMATVARRLRSRKNAVRLQQQRIEQLQNDWNALHERIMNLRKHADQLAVDLKEQEDLVVNRRAALNTTKTNKEYAAILTQINTLKADSVKTEEDALKALQDVEQVRVEADAVQEQIQTEQKRLTEIEEKNSGEIARLNKMHGELSTRRQLAAAEIDPEALAVFDRVAATYDGEAMAMVEIHGRKPPFRFVCGGCFMNLNAEHANALRVRDEIRTCDNCGRILYLEREKEQSAAR